MYVLQISKFVYTFIAMSDKQNIFKIETNHIVPAKGKILISEPFLDDFMFGRSVILLIDCTQEGSMGLVLNKPLPLSLNDLLKETDLPEEIPLYQGGPMCLDTLFYLHTLEGIACSLPISKGFYLNGDFADIKHYIRQGGNIKGNLRFFLGYSGWAPEQLDQEIKENTWLVGKEDVSTLMDETDSNKLWAYTMAHLGQKYKVWTHFPQVPTLN